MVIAFLTSPLSLRGHWLKLFLNCIWPPTGYPFFFSSIFGYQCDLGWIPLISACLNFLICKIICSPMVPTQFWGWNELMLCMSKILNKKRKYAIYISCYHCYHILITCLRLVRHHHCQHPQKQNFRQGLLWKWLRQCSRKRMGEQSWEERSLSQATRPTRT